MNHVVLAFFLLALTAFGQTRGRFLDYALVLSDEPVARKTHSRLALQSTEARQHLEKIRGAQSGVLAELKRRRVQVTGTGQILVNAVFVSATRETADQLKSIPGVAYVVKAPQLHMDLDRALDLQNVKTAWT